MSQGAITSSIDVAQVTLYLFWLFFAGLIFYLRREDKREGYPLEDTTVSPHNLREGLFGRPNPKTFVLPHGGIRVRPEHWVQNLQVPTNAWLGAPWPGAPIEPIGDPFLAGLGPGSWANRPDEPDLTIDGHPKIIPMRADADYSIDRRDPDPRGKEVFGADGNKGGKVTDVWVDRSERLFRYLEVEVAGGHRVLLPVNFSKISRDGSARVRSINGNHFENVPRLRNENVVTMLEEEKIVAYYGAGTLYAAPSRMGPLL